MEHRHKKLFHAGSVIFIIGGVLLAYMVWTLRDVDLTLNPYDGEEKHVTAYKDLIELALPTEGDVVGAPLVVSGKARGAWFFEGSFPLTLTNWDGLIIAEGYATAEGEWMTEEYVPFTGTLEYTSPYKEGDPDFMKRGSLILQKDNPSGLPEHDDALEITVYFE